VCGSNPANRNAIHHADYFWIIKFADRKCRVAVLHNWTGSEPNVAPDQVRSRLGLGMHSGAVAILTQSCGRIGRNGLAETSVRINGTEIINLLC
jgi:hypothetical protein